MRLIVLDTETTGLNANNGDRVIEIGCVEIINRRLTGAHFHTYLDPERDIDPEAVAVHGLTRAFLSDKPKFADMVKPLQEFVGKSKLIIHNAAFDLGFLDAEFKRLGLSSFRSQAGEVLDTLLEARKMYPGKRNSLDALCERLGISNAHRTLHGALLDAELLAEAYLAMTRGQTALAMPTFEKGTAVDQVAPKIDFRTLNLPVLKANEEELEAHKKTLERLNKQVRGTCLWQQLEIAIDSENQPPV